jgi:muramoyltetrapeptide carboxypeptidase LdcA involved in peptidoglycan recycling
MRGADMAEVMASAVDRMVSAREEAGALDRAIKAVVGTIGRFSEKDATRYLQAYRAEMVMRDIPEDRRLSGFLRVATPGIHAEVLERPSAARA